MRKEVGAYLIAVAFKREKAGIGFTFTLAPYTQMVKKSITSSRLFPCTL